MDKACAPYRLCFVALLIVLQSIVSIHGIGYYSKASNYVITNTTSGPVRGEVISVLEFWDVRLARFLGIPYAAPPTGRLRFQKPEPPAAWTNTRDALAFGSECMQRDVPSIHFNNSEAPIPANRSEDCLYLNVYAPQASQPRQDSPAPASAALPVMVWIHGGGFTLGAGSQYDAAHLAAKGVLVVTVNYRLDVFGFLSTEDEVIPGNYGMFDQIAALTWVHNNIAKFGGDPGKVTIFGESAGAASVSLLVLSPLTQGLFQRAITESGSSLNPWSVNFQRNKFSHKLGTNMIATMGVKCMEVLSNSTALLECLQAEPADRLLYYSVALEAALTFNIWTPRVDSTNGFLPDSPLSLLSQGRFHDVDTIRGVNGDEMGFFLPMLPANQSLPVANARGVLSSVLAQFEDVDQESILALMESTYTKASPSGTITNQETMDALSAFMFVGPTATELSFAANRNTFKKHYMYQFTHRPSKTLIPGWSSVHTDELGYVFNVTLKEFTERRSGPPDAGDIQVSNLMMEMWTNFARNGDPTPTGHEDLTPILPKWPTYSNKAANYLKIDVVPQVSSFPFEFTTFYMDALQIMTNGNSSQVY